MALIGTISGSVGAGGALTSNNAITGTLVIADTTENFPTIASDAVLFVSGNINGGSKSVIGGDLVVSGTTKTLSDLTFSGSNFYIGGNVSFQNDILFLDKANSRVGIGTSSPDSDLTLRTSNSANIRGVSGLHYDNSTAFSQFKFIGGRARGSTGSPAAVQADDSLASFNGRGYKTTGWSNTVGGLYIYAKEAWTDSSTPTYITLRGVAAGAGTTVSEWAKLESTGLTVTQDITGSSANFSGNITGSNALVSGDLAVNGGDITTTAATFNLVDSAATTVNFARAATGLTIGASTGVTTIQNVITASSGKIALTNEAGSSLTFPVGAGALGAPTFTNSSIGTRIRMYPSVGPAGADWAMGMESGAMWFGVPAATSASRFRWYGGTTEVANLTGDGVLTVAGVVSASGDLAVNGGDITTTFAGTFNLLNLTSSQALTVGGSAGTINIGSTSTATTTTNIQTATNSAAGTIKTINIGTQTAGSGQVYVNIGSTTARLGNARITLHNEVHLTSGTLVGSPGGISNELTLVSSGSVVVRLDTNNDGPGHRFEIRDWSGGTEFAVSETGDAEIAGNLLITGSSLSTQTTTTFNLLNTSLTGTLNVSSLASEINFGGSLTTSSFSGEVNAGAKTILGSVSEKLTHTSSNGSIVNFDLRNNGVFYVTNPSTANITANFINTQTTTNRVITPTIILSQSATPRIVSGIQVNSASGSILWANNVVPTGNANKQDVFGFSLIRSGTVWIALGQMSTYG